MRRLKTLIQAALGESTFLSRFICLFIGGAVAVILGDVFQEVLVPLLGWQGGWVRILAIGLGVVVGGCVWVLVSGMLALLGSKKN